MQRESPAIRLRDVRVTLYDGSYHSVDSSENAFKVAGSMAFKEAAEQAQPTLLEPIMQASVVVPEDAVGDVIGDLNGRRGRPLGMEPKGVMTEIKAEVPMAEMLNYAPDLRSITGGRGEYSMEFARYEIPAHRPKVISPGAGGRGRSKPMCDRGGEQIPCRGTRPRGVPARS
jgi:elongation factor G